MLLFIMMPSTADARYHAAIYAIFFHFCERCVDIIVLMRHDAIMFLYFMLVLCLQILSLLIQRLLVFFETPFSA